MVYMAISFCISFGEPLQFASRDLTRILRYFVMRQRESAGETILAELMHFLLPMN